MKPSATRAAPVSPTWSGRLETNTTKTTAPAITAIAPTSATTPAECGGRCGLSIPTTSTSAHRMRNWDAARTNPPRRAAWPARAAGRAVAIRRPRGPWAMASDATSGPGRGPGDGPSGGASILTPVVPGRSHVSTEHRRRIDTLLDPSFLEGIDGLPLDELRSRRKMAEEVETELSFYRRLIHGRMDLVALELRGSDGAGTRSLVDALPEVLAVGLRAPDAPTRLIQVEAPDLPEVRNRALDRVLDDGFPGILPDLPDEELDGIWDRLIEAERDVSAQRRSVHQVTDALHGEIVRRYKQDPRQAITG